MWFVAGLGTVALFVDLPKPSVSEPGVTGSSAAPAVSTNLLLSRDNPWGDLEVIRMPLRHKEGYSSAYAHDHRERLRPPRWFFAGQTKAQVEGLFDSCDLDVDQREELQNPGRWHESSNGCYVLPSRMLIRNLTSASRQRIYSVLASSPSNYSQCYAFRFPRSDFVPRLAESGLSSNTVRLVESLAYTNRNTICFADLEVLRGQLSGWEFARVMRTLYHVPAYRLRLRVHPDSDAHALAVYWGKGGRVEKIQPMLESLTQETGPENATLSIGYLLPPFPRLRLNTFPVAWNEPEAEHEDCFWTSMNFFNDQPDNRFLDTRFVRRTLDQDYDLVAGVPTFGDLIAVYDRAGSALHMCVYIADDFVFTKNGAGGLFPWVLMKMRDMLLLYPVENGNRLVVYRRKDL